jgi:tRNA/rRNA methyltransferase
MNDMSPLDRIRIVLSHTSHPGNIGATARAMKTMGLSRLVLVNPKSFPDPQADAMASGAVDVLERAQVFETLEDALVGTAFSTAMTARRRGLAVEALWAREAAGELAVLSHAMEVALVFGNETSGLSNEEVSMCMRWAKIPTDPDSSSLNLAQAVQVMCYELRMALVDAGAPPPVNDAGEHASHDEIEGLMAHLERAVTGSGFLDPAQPKRLMPRMRRMFARAGLEKEEVNILRGMLSSFETGPYRKRE